MPLDVSEYTAGAATQVLAEPCIIEQQLAIGKTPTAGPTNKRLAANQPEIFGVQPGHRLAVTGTV